MLNTIEIEEKHGISFCKRIPLIIERGLGSIVWDSSQKQYLDFTSGWGVASLGHSHPVVVNAIAEQAGKLIQSPNANFIYSPIRSALLEQLNEITPKALSHFYFLNSGAEANDLALKLVRKITGRERIVSAINSFHGRTYNTLTVSTGHHVSEAYLPKSSNTDFIPFGDVEYLKRAINEETAGVILEPIQGEGGIRIPDADYLCEVKKLCELHGALLIVDEIQTGFGRCGNLFASTIGYPNFSPHLMTMGKGLAGGFPFAALGVSKEVNAKINLGDHGGTFCGNPLACAVSLAVINFLKEQDISMKVAKDGMKISQNLTELKNRFPRKIREIRGRGLLWALDLSEDCSVDYITAIAMEKGLLVVPTRNNILRLLPSLLATDLELESGLAILGEVFDSVGQ